MDVGKEKCPKLQLDGAVYTLRSKKLLIGIKFLI